MKYTVAYGVGFRFNFAIDNLAKKVNSLLADGYQPLGGVSVSVNPDVSFCVAQAMIKED